jgi:tetratricopeptide (TPR) repeat protein
MTEDLITDLSKLNGVFVIARNSTFVYKGKAGDVRDIAKTLGVRYVLEGSVRRVGSDVRVNAQLIDATTGAHLWAERYDTAMKDVFSLQDKVTRGVVGALSLQLTKDESARVERKETANAEAYDVFLKGWQHYLKHTPADFKSAVTYFNTAVNIDPKYTRAYAALAATYWKASRRYWGEVAFGFRDSHDAQYQAEQALAKAMLDPTPLARQVASGILLQSQQYDEALTEAQKAIAADPNDADGYIEMASILCFTGKAREARELVERAMRLNPHYPPSYIYQLGLSEYAMQRYDDAAASLERATSLDPGDYWSPRLLLATYGLLGRKDDAAKLLATMKAHDKRGVMGSTQDPITVRALAFWYPFANQADLERFASGLHKAGVPD